MEEKRSDPNILLKRIKQEEQDQKDARKRGKLKVFLGYCPGVGKTYRMLQEAMANKMSGEDVTIALAETHGRKETEALLAGLEVIPRKKVEYSGIVLEEMDTDAVLKRHPAIAIVDELAHTNAPGSRHIKRYQDVEELLNAGIDVFTTINIQHIESLNDVVRQITGVKVGETVPDKILELAREVELVDLTPEKLTERLKAGKVYIPPQVKLAMYEFFKKGNLLALRELSLSYTAKTVDEDVLDYMSKNAVAGPWQVGSRLMTGITASKSSGALLRFTHRMAQDLDAEWFAVYVESPQQIEANEKTHVQLDKNIRLAEELGARVVLLKGTDVAQELLEFARGKNVTLIIAGHSRRNWFQRFFRGAVLDNLIGKGGPISVLIAGNQDVAEGTSGYQFPRGVGVRSYLAAFLAVAVTTLIGLLLRASSEPVNIAMILLLPSIASGILWGMRVGLFASLLSVAAFDFFFVPPYLTFSVSDIRYLPGFAVFIIVSLITGFLAKSLRRESESSAHRERFVYSLYSFTKTIMAADREDIVDRAVKNISEAFECSVAVFMSNASGKVNVAAKDKETVQISETELAVATWVCNNGQPAGKGTNTLSSSAWYYLPLKVQDKVIGAIGLKPASGDGYLSVEQDQLFESFASVVALAIAKSSK
jgi:two-component system sensor histidine kinase KdpD